MNSSKELRWLKNRLKKRQKRDSSCLRVCDTKLSPETILRLQFSESLQESFHLKPFCHFAADFFVELALALPHDLRDVIYPVLDFLGQVNVEAFNAFCMISGLANVRFAEGFNPLFAREAILEFSKTPELQKGLKLYGQGIGKQEIELICVSLFEGSIIGFSKQLGEAREHIDEQTFNAMAYQLFLMGDHIESSASLAAGHTLCDAGDLVLHWKGSDSLKPADRELCLSRRASDGMLSFFEPFEEKAPSISSIKKLREFVRSYDGPKMLGEISPHPKAEKLCRAIGLSVRHGYGFLEPA